MIKSNTAIVIKGLKKLENNAIDTKPLMKKIAADMNTKVAFRFRQGKDPNGKKWEPLSDTTIKMRRKGSSKPLQDTGALSLSMNYKYTKDTAISGTNKIYAAYQNFPVKKGEFKKSERETVRKHTRRGHTRTSRLGNTYQVGEHEVSEHERKNNGSPWGDKPGREFIGFSENQRKTYATWIGKYFKTGGVPNK